MQQSMHLHSFAPIFTYSAFNMHVNNQINIDKYIYITYIYVLKAQYMHIWSVYMHIW